MRSFVFVSRRRPRPFEPIVQRSLSSVLIRRANTIALPLGDQLGSLSRRPRVSRTCARPSERATYRRPPRTNAIRRPSGEIAGSVPAVSLCLPLPSAFIAQI